MPIMLINKDINYNIWDNIIISQHIIMIAKTNVEANITMIALINNIVVGYKLGKMYMHFAIFVNISILA